MILPCMVVRAFSKRSWSSASSSSSVHSESGRLAPPCSTFLETSRTMVSIRRLRAVPPGGLSKYCLTSIPLNPATPPKYCMTISSTSAECGMFAPPRNTESENRSAPAFSICWRAFWRRLAADFSLFFRRSFRQSRHTRDHSGFPLRSRTWNWSVVLGKLRPQWLQVA